MKRIRYALLIMSILSSFMGGCASRTVDEQAAIVTVTEPLQMQLTNAEETSTDSVMIEQTETAMAELAEGETNPENREVSLVMVGDVLLHTKVYESGLMEDGSYNYDHMFAHVKEDIEAADIALVNQEVILGGRELGLSDYPAFNGAYEVGDSLVDAGFDVILHATNHALDKGKKGLLNCIHFWKEEYPDIAVLGIHETEEESQEIYVQEINGIRIAILNYTYGTNGIPLPLGMPYAVEVWNEEQITQDVAHAQENADFVIVCPHWGTEYVLQETADQRNKAQFLADLGVDLVIGTHPHVVEPVEWVTGVSGNEMLVYYSLGNFINATSGTGEGKAARMLGAMAKVSIIMDEEKQEVYISEYGIEPLVTHNVSGRGQITTYKLQDYTEELAAQNEMKYQDAAFSLSYCEDICNEVFGELYFTN